MEQISLYHHGILGQKWGKRNGPPYPLSGGDYSPEEKQKIYKERHARKNSIYNKKHFDEVLTKGITISTLSYDKNRTKNTEMFYAVSDKFDAHQYNALFNWPIPKPILDDNGKEIGTGMFLKYKITNEAQKDIKVASEDSGAEVFKELYSSNRDFYNFVSDENRMRKLFVDDKYKFRGYREARAVLERLDKGESMTEKDVKTLYRMFNYVIPSDGGGSARGAKDIATQRARFFAALGKKGYSAVLDTNDAIYGGFKAKSPIIVFDQSAFALKGISETTMASKTVSGLVLVGRRALGL